MTTEQRPASMTTDHGSRINKQGIPQILISPGAPGLITERQRRAAYRRRPACPECRQDARPTNYARAPLPYSPNCSLPPQRSASVTCNLSPVTSSRPRRAAFSLAEILIAIFVLSIGLIMIAAVFPVAAKWTAQDAQTSVAQVIAKNAVAQIQAQFGAGNLPAGVLNSPTAAQPFTGFGPFAYQFGTAQPYPFGTAQAYSNTANFAPSPLDPSPTSPTPAPVPPPGSYYWSAVLVPAASGYAGVSPSSGQMNNVFTVYVFVFNKGQDANVFSAPAYGSPSTGNTLIPMQPYAQNSVASHLSFYPQLFEGEYQFAVPAMPVDSLGVDVSTGSVFRLITDPATNALVPTGLAGGSVINTTSDYVIFAPPALGQTSSPLIYVYVTTVNL